MSSSPGLVNHSPLAERTLGDQISISRTYVTQTLHVLEVSGPGSFCMLQQNYMSDLFKQGRISVVMGACGQPFW